MLPPEKHARKICAHPKWSWRCGMVLYWPSMDRSVVITNVTVSGVIVSFLGQGIGVEVDPEAQDLYPDLTHPATAGMLLAMWLEASPQAFMSIARWGEQDTGLEVVQTQPKRWAITMDLGLYDIDAEGSYLGTALARVLYGTWMRQLRLTPARLPSGPGL